MFPSMGRYNNTRLTPECWKIEKKRENFKLKKNYPPMRLKEYNWCPLSQNEIWSIATISPLPFKLRNSLWIFFKNPIASSRVSKFSYLSLIGLTLCDEEGHYPEDVCTWQFNFRFSIVYVGDGPVAKISDGHASEKTCLAQSPSISFTKAALTLLVTSRRAFHRTTSQSC